MEQILTPTGGAIFLAVYGFAMIGITSLFARSKESSRSDFLLAGRDVGVLPGALSIAASWIWAPALFISSQKAYEQGLPGIFWFTVPNVLSLVVFAPFAFRIRRLLPDGYTLPQYMRVRHGKAVHLLYVIQFFGLQICSFAVQILAGSALIQLMTGLSFHVVAVALVVIALAYSARGGVRASIVTDCLQMGLILAISLISIPWVVSAAGGLDVVTAGFSGVKQDFGNIFDPWVAYSFGIPVTIGLLSGPLGDQMHWQRAYALKSDSDVIKTFALGAIFFVVVPVTLSVLGFVAASPGVIADGVITNNQLVGATVVAHLLPHFMLIVFSIMLLSGLCSTLDSILCAASSLATVDVMGARSGRESDVKESRNVRIARVSMCLTALIGLTIACIPGLQIVHLFLFYGTWRASTMIPTALTIMWPRLNSKAVFLAILGSLLLGAPVYAAGAILKNPHLSVAGSIAVVVIGLVVCTVGTAVFAKRTETLA